MDTQTQPASPTVISLTVGDYDEPSTITINNGDSIVAASGVHGWDTFGGDGYSGGGDNCKDCNGGSDGLDGRGSDGGGGTWEDVTSYKFDFYEVSPGAGGEYYYSGSQYFGGGGGGVLINGDGPGVELEDNKGTGLWSDGQGYGGGGTYGSTGDNGKAGVVIVEIITEN